MTGAFSFWVRSLVKRSLPTPTAVARQPRSVSYSLGRSDVRDARNRGLLRRSCLEAGPGGAAAVRVPLRGPSVRPGLCGHGGFLRAVSNRARGEREHDPRRVASGAEAIGRVPRPVALPAG